MSLLDPWDQAVEALHQIVVDWDERLHTMDSHGEAHEFEEAIVAASEEAWGLLAKPLERVALLGPEPVDAAVQEMEAAFRDDAQAWLARAASPRGPEVEWGSKWPDTMTRLHAARKAFLRAAKDELRRVPQPGK